MATNDTYVLWGSPHSYYTGKIRSYLIKKRVPYRELTPTHPDFGTRVVPTIRNMVVPVLERPDGGLIQDTTDMIDHLEREFPSPIMIPQTPVQKAVAWLLGAFGSEALLPPGMHYRWSYRAEQERFLRAEFGRLVYAGPERAVRDEAGRQLMDYFNGFLPPLGVTETSIPTIEAAYCELLDALDQHFQQWPYLLGGRPSIADFGFMAPLFAHLGRDPVPATLMKNRAQNVFNWTERMNLPAIVDREFPSIPDSFPADDTIPESLFPVLRLVFQDWGPQLLADARHYNAWVEADPSMPAGRMVSSIRRAQDSSDTRTDRVPVARHQDHACKLTARPVALRQGCGVRARTGRRRAFTLRLPGPTRRRRVGDGDKAGAGDEARGLRAGACLSCG